MELTWWGAAGFRIKSGRQTLLIDPYLSRNRNARPIQYLNAGDIQEGQHIFVSHGHFDHLMDVPTIAKKTGATVHCSRETASMLLMKGVARERISEVVKDGSEVMLPGIQAEGLFSEHVVFDRKLIMKTLLRGRFKLLKHLHLFKEYPAGQVLSWRFIMERKVLHYFGTSGSPAEEMERLSLRHTDILLVPLQGHSEINSIALEYVHVMQPAIVIPHHHDNFFPPVSDTVDISSFIKRVKKECPSTEVKVMEVNETLIL